MTLADWKIDMNFIVNIPEQQISTFMHALQILVDVHCGNFQNIAGVPNLYDEGERDILSSSLEQLSPLVTGSLRGQCLSIDNAQVSSEGKIAHDWYELLDAKLRKHSPHFLSGSVSEDCVQVNEIVVNP